jgi:hypothetical protein
MSRVSRPRIAAGVALASAGLIAVVPTATTPPNVQHRQVQLTTTEAGDINFPEVDGTTSSRTPRPTGTGSWTCTTTPPPSILCLTRYTRRV